MILPLIRKLQSKFKLNQMSKLMKMQSKQRFKRLLIKSILKLSKQSGNVMQPTLELQSLKKRNVNDKHKQSVIFPKLQTRLMMTMKQSKLRMLKLFRIKRYLIPTRVILINNSNFNNNKQRKHSKSNSIKSLLIIVIEPLN